MHIRSAVPEDAVRLLEIYAPYVTETAVSFEYRPPEPEEFRRRIRRTLEGYPYLVLEEAGRIQGYAYAGALGVREAYRPSCEVSIYLDRSARGRGWGRALYQALEEQLRTRGVCNLYACIAEAEGEDEYLNRDSQRFHERMGYVTVGRFHRCGYKFGRWYNVIWMEKFIGGPKG